MYAVFFYMHLSLYKCGSMPFFLVGVSHLQAADDLCSRIQYVTQLNMATHFKAEAMWRRWKGV